MNNKIQTIFIVLFLITVKQLGAQTLGNYKAISDSFYYAGKFDTSLKYAKKAELIIINDSGKNSNAYAEFVGQYYGLIYSALTKIDSAIYWHKYSIQLLEQANDTDSQVYGAELGNYGNLLDTYVSYTEAFPYLQKAYIILQNHQEVVDDYLASINNLATHYNYIGEYSNAEMLFKKNLEEVQKHPELDPTRKYVVFHNLSNVYVKTGNYTLAEMYLTKAKNVPTTTSEGKYDYVLSTKDLANLYLSTNKYKKADKLYNELLADSVFKPENINNPENNCISLYPDIINGLGNIKEAQKQYKTAENLYKTSVSAARGSKLPSLYKYEDLFFLAHLYANTARYVEADSLYTLLFTKIDSNTLSHDRFFYTKLYVGYCSNLIKWGQMQKAAKKATFITKVLLEDFHNNFPGMTEEQQLEYVHSLGNYFNLAFSAFTAKFSNNNTYIKLALNELLQFKGIILTYQTRRFQSLRTSQDTALASMNRNWLSLKEKLYKKSEGSLIVKMDADSLNRAVDDLDQKISLKTGVATDNKNDKLPDEISSHLKENEAALEYVHYKKIQNGANVYGVFVIRNGQAPEYVELCTEKQLKDCLKENNVTAIQSQVVHSDAIYNLVWKPVAAMLKKSTTIYYSLDGLLNYFSFDGIKTGTKTFLLTDKKLVQLTSVRNLLNATLNDNGMNAAVLWGEIDCSEEAYFPSTTKPYPKSKNKYNDDSKGQGHFEPWKDEELPAIINITKDDGITSKVYAKKNATEENFKQHAASFKGVLHISSHGFYSNQPNEKNVAGNGSPNPFNTQLNPLLRCGLILNGGNYVFDGNKPLPDREDGILTGYEIALMDLSKVNLVVLSACETGLGDIDPGSEGVLGLQRAFKLAGVQKMLLTLWEVNVKDTKTFMTYFYTELLLHKKNAVDALHAAKWQMAKQNPPLAWAGFVLVE